MPEFHQRVGVLCDLGCVDDSGTVTIKGRAAVEINSTQVHPPLPRSPTLPQRPQQSCLVPSVYPILVHPPLPPPPRLPPV
jgi:hypothetical protein